MSVYSLYTTPLEDPPNSPARPGIPDRSDHTFFNTPASFSSLVKTQAQVSCLTCRPIDLNYPRLSCLPFTILPAPRILPLPSDSAALPLHPNPSHLLPAPAFSLPRPPPSFFLITHNKLAVVF
ncbi:hypothetical protein PtA15_12A102 [Puccinia triticina]|uniref:Uncharacterized protein n=1 Tax=Puccinia triticina TaxID=208348 RepID=A0ABY7D5B6_9BASI|nr:uncharacterized protein PtA15_12A102 [Puccinia triticina]WAQ90117.1 hypothetical protein PtA15_12A102 [Puccinia triticina]WAR61402.1 hypothetical protein PtB15_12B87 [Puccinia triticina]